MPCGGVGPVDVVEVGDDPLHAFLAQALRAVAEDTRLDGDARFLISSSQTPESHLYSKLLWDDA